MRKQGGSDADTLFVIVLRLVDIVVGLLFSDWKNYPPAGQTNP